MRTLRIFLSGLCILSITGPLSGCWNYREADDLAIVSGFAVDKDGDNYQVAFEIIEIGRGQESSISTRTLTSEGATIFEAARKTIKSAGKRLYFSHAEILVIGKDVAEEGIVPIMDWVARDAELRMTISFVISKEKTAREILQQEATGANVLSYELEDMLRSQKSLSYAYDTAEYEFLQELAAPGISATMPAAGLKTDAAEEGKTIVEISGSGVFKEDRLVGFLDGEETRTLLFIKNKIKGGVLVETMDDGDEEGTDISLEILDNKTKLKPRYDGSAVTVEIEIQTDTAMDEIGGRQNYMEEEPLQKLIETAQASLENNVRNLVKRVQEDYGCDIFGFGKSIKKNMPGVWKRIEPQWEEMFRNVNVEVKSDINVKNTAIIAKPIIVGD